MTLFDNLPLGRKLAVLVIAMLLALGGLAVFSAHEVRQGMLSERLQQLRATVESARSVAAGLEAEVQAGRLTHDQAIDRFAHLAMTMTYDHGNGYVFVYTMDGLTLAHPNTAQVGTNQLDVLTNGIAIARLLRDGVQQAGEIVLPYSYFRPGAKTLSPKIAYAAGFAPWRIFIGSGAYIDDIDAMFFTFAERLGAIVLLVAGGLALLAYAMARRITRPLNRLESRMRTLADGTMEPEVPGTDRRDEIGRMAQAVRVFRENALRVQQLEQAQASQQARAAEERRATLAGLMRTFESGAGAVVQSVGDTASAMRDAARGLTDTAADTTRESGAAAEAGERSSANVQTVASAAEELSASVGEISRQVAESAAIAQQAVTEMGRTDGSVQELSASAQRIGEIVALINGIATQTNLLALNATIEAARAGEAGKGFAVVASEVKALASQTARATDDIRVQIEGMQTATGQTVEAVRGITGTIGRISEIAAAIASAVEQQGAATREIAGNVQQAAAGAQDISASIGRVSAMAGRTTHEAQRLLGSADALSAQSGELKTQVAGLLSAMRAA